VTNLLIIYYNAAKEEIITKKNEQIAKKENRIKELEALLAKQINLGST